MGDIRKNTLIGFLLLFSFFLCLSLFASTSLASVVHPPFKGSPGQLPPDSEWILNKSSPVNTMAFSADERYIASGSNDNIIRLWNLQTNSLIHLFEGHSNKVTSIAFSSDGRFLASGSYDKTVRLWDLQTRSLIKVLDNHSDRVTSVAFSPNGNFLASGSRDNTVLLWDIRTRSIAHVFNGHSEGVTSVAFSSNMRFLASGSGDKSVRLWDLQNHSLSQVFEGHTSDVSSIGFSLDGRFLASGSRDKSVILWDLQARSLAHVFEGHSDGVTSVAFSSDGNFFASGSRDKSVRLWDLQTRNVANIFEGHNNTVTSVAFSSGGRFLASGSYDNTMRLWDLQTQSLVSVFGKHSNRITSVATSFNGRFLALGTEDNTVLLWDLQTRTLAHIFEGHNDTVVSVNFSPNGHFLASGSEDNTVRLWDLDTLSLAHTFKGHSETILSVAFSPNGRFLASGSSDKTVRLWEIQTRSLAHNFEGDSGEGVWSVAFSPDSRFIAYASLGENLQLWDLENYTISHSFDGDEGMGMSVVFSPDGKFLASGTFGDTVLLWDLQTYSLEHVFKGHGDIVGSIAFSPDGGLLASGSWDNTVRLWDLQTLSLNQIIEGHTGLISSVAFSPDGRFIASSSNDSTLRMWDTKLRKWSYTIACGLDSDWAIWNDDGKLNRWDGGYLILNKGKNGALSPLRPPKLAKQDTLIVSYTSAPVEIETGKSSLFSLKVTNTGEDTAYWIRPERINISNSSLSIHPNQVDELAPSESKSIELKITSQSPIIPKPIDEFMAQFNLITAAGKIPVSIPVVVHSPKLTFNQANLLDDGVTLSIELENKGNQSIPEAFFQLQANGFTSVPIVLKNIVPASKSSPIQKLAFTLPENFKVDNDSQITLIGWTSGLPKFKWNFANQTIMLPGNPLWFYLALVILAMMLLYITFWYKRYKHPLVVTLTEQPKQLIQLLPEQLFEARSRLLDTSRLDMVLTTAQVSRTSLNKAVEFTLAQSTPLERAQSIAARLSAGLEELNTSKEQSLFKLQLGDDFPLNLKACYLYFPLKIEVLDVFSRLKELANITGQVCLILGPNREFQLALHRKTVDRSNKYVAPVGTEITKLLLSPEPGEALAQVLAGQLALTQLSPYQLGGGVNKEAAFYGRAELISHILNRDPANYLVVGGRQVGKSSLLKALDRRYQELPEWDCYYLVLSDKVLIPRLARELGLETSASLSDIAAFAKQQNKRQIFLIDEADKFIQHERKQDYQILQSLRQMSEEGHCSFVLAGFWQLYQHAVLDYQSPLKNFGEILSVGKLDTDACQALATEPMRSLGLEYADPSLLDELIQQTGQRANLVAMACHQMIDQTTPGQRILEAGDLHSALNSDKVRNAMKGWSKMTDSPVSNQLDKLIVLSTISLEKFSYKEVVERLKIAGINADSSAIERSLERLQLGFVLGKDESNQYFYRVPLFQQSISQDDPESRLPGAAEEYLSLLGS